MTQLSFLIKVEPEKYFVLKNGFFIRSLPELATALNEIDDNIFNHHVNVDNNDFANWIEHVIGDSVLTNRIKGVTEKRELIQLLVNRINEIKYNSDDSQHPEYLDDSQDVKLDESLNNFNNSSVAATELKDEIEVELPPDVPPDLEVSNKEYDDLPVEAPPNVPPDEQNNE